MFPKHTSELAPPLKFYNFIISIFYKYEKTLYPKYMKMLTCIILKFYNFIISIFYKYEKILYPKYMKMVTCIILSSITVFFLICCVPLTIIVFVFWNEILRLYSFIVTYRICVILYYVYSEATETWSSTNKRHLFIPLPIKLSSVPSWHFLMALWR
jgi:hypothetical protein